MGVSLRGKNMSGKGTLFEGQNCTEVSTYLHLQINYFHNVIIYKLQ